MTMFMRRVFTVVFAVGVLAFNAAGLAACTSATGPTDPVATTGPMSTGSSISGSSTTPPTTTTATAVPTTGTAGTAPYPAGVPAAARANTTEGAKAFVKYYVSLVNEAYTTPKVGLLPPLSSSSCKTCATFENNASVYVARGYRYDQAATEIFEVAPAWDDTSSGPKRVMDATGHQNAAKILDASNRVVKAIDPADYVMVMTISWTTSGWVVDLIQVAG